MATFTGKLFSSNGPGAGTGTGEAEWGGGGGGGGGGSWEGAAAAPVPAAVPGPARETRSLTKASAGVPQSRAATLSLLEFFSSEETKRYG